MKKFFKKIGKGFKEIGKGLKKFFTSKVGRILGIVMLTVSMAGLATNLFQGLGRKGLEEGIKSAAIEGSGEIVKKGVKEGVKKGVGEVVKSEVSSIPSLMTGGDAELLKTYGVKTSALPIEVNSANEVFTATQDLLSSSAGDINASTIVEATNQVMKPSLVSNTNTLEGALAHFKPFGSVTPVGEAGVQTTLNAADLTEHLTSRNALSKLSEGAIEQRITDLSTNPNFLSASTQQKELALLRSFTPSNAEWAKGLSNPKMRSFYTEIVGDTGIKFGQSGASDFFAGSTPLDLPPINNIPGVREFGNVREAWQGVPRYDEFGEIVKPSLMERTGNVISHGLETNIAELTRGSYVGKGATAPVASTAYTTGSIASNILAEPPEPPSYPSGASMAVSGNILNTGSDYLTNTLSSMDYANSFNEYEGTDYLQLFNNINQKAGGHVYGPNAINTGFLG